MKPEFGMSGHFFALSAPSPARLAMRLPVPAVPVLRPICPMRS